MLVPRDDRDHVLLGRIASAHGVRGHLLIRTYTEKPDDIAAYGALSDGKRARSFEIRVIRVTSKGVIAAIAGIEDRTAAEAVAGTDLWVARSRLPETGEGEFYHADLIGLVVVGPDGDEIGRVAALHNFGAGDLLEIRLAGRRRTELVPFTEAFVPDIDLARGRVTVNMPQADA